MKKYQCQARRLTRDHCPSDPEERKRVQEAGGTVTSDSIGQLPFHRPMIFFCALKVTEERDGILSWIRIWIPSVSVRIRIRTKMSRIPNTGL
jgi:hypothetical protein